MERFLGGAAARFVLVPLLGVFLLNYCRVLSRRRRSAREGDTEEKAKRWRPEDLAVGLDMTVLAIVSLLGLVVERVHSVLNAQTTLHTLLSRGSTLSSNQHTQELRSAAIANSATSDFLTYVVAAFLFTILLFSLSALVEGFGRDKEGDLRTSYGIVLPDILGALCLFVVWALAINGGAA